MLQFLCPNEHKIRCPDTQAGRGAKCPKCGAAFKVPAIEVAGEKDGVPPAELVKAEVVSDSKAPPAQSAPSTAPPAPKTPKEPEIEFLCPNGHRLHGPTSLQGKPGQCPECGSKFRIPSYEEDISSEERVEQELSVGRADGEESTVGLPGDEPIASRDEEVEPTYQLDLDEGRQEPASAPAVAAPHPLANLFPSLWTHKTSGVVVEVVLTGGESLVPESFAQDASGQFALFSVRSSNGSHTITAVAWSNVVQVLVRGLRFLPGDLFPQG